MTTKILVIDDEKPTLAMFRLFLGAYGYTVLMAGNGTEGLALFDEEKPSIVITDIKMPGMDGLEVLRRIKELDPATEVIVMTGHGDMELALQALKLNATDFINKPLRKADLEAALKRAEQRRLRCKESEITLEVSDTVATLAIKGELTSSSRTLLLSHYRQALQSGASRLVVHFDENCSLSGAGISLLVYIIEESKRRNQPLSLVGLSENLKKIFNMVEIAKLTGIFADNDPSSG